MKCKCEHCGKEFEASQEAKYCSSKCRQKAYRARKKAEQAQKSDGVTLHPVTAIESHEIAENSVSQHDEKMVEVLQAILEEQRITREFLARLLAYQPVARSQQPTAQPEPVPAMIVTEAEKEKPEDIAQNLMSMF